jgi:hypothetical protein
MKIDKTHLPPGLILFLLSLLWILSCRHTANIDNLPVVCFEKEVLPIFQRNCAISGCHDGSHEGRAFNSYVNISREVTPGKPYSSNLYQAIIGNGGNIMPPSTPLSLENRTIISVWIEQGANLTTCNDTSTTGGGGSGGTLKACYSRDIQPVLTSKCATALCHDVTTHREGYIFSSYTQTLLAVRPGSPSGSVLYTSITGTSENHMPPSGKVQVTTAEKDSISAWISYGALNQTCGETCDTINPITYSGTIWPIMQSSCTGCHSASSPSGGVTISGYSDVSALAASGALMNSLRGNGVTRMPSGTAFSTCRIRQFQIWVNNGHLNN